MQIVMRPLDGVTPYEHNPRDNSGAVDAVAASIAEYGFRQPIVVDSAGVIIAGHTRYLAAVKLGLDEIPVHVAEGLTEDQVTAYRLADNKVGELATWDLSMLDIEVARLPDLDLTQFGFDAPATLDPPDEFPEVDENIETEHECPKCGYEWSGGSS